MPENRRESIDNVLHRLLEISSFVVNSVFLSPDAERTQMSQVSLITHLKIIQSVSEDIARLSDVNKTLLSKAFAEWISQNVKQSDYIIPKVHQYFFKAKEMIIQANNFAPSYADPDCLIYAIAFGVVANSIDSGNEIRIVEMNFPEVAELIRKNINSNAEFNNDISKAKEIVSERAVAASLVVMRFAPLYDADYSIDILENIFAGINSLADLLVNITNMLKEIAEVLRINEKIPEFKDVITNLILSTTNQSVLSPHMTVALDKYMQASNFADIENGELVSLVGKIIYSYLWLVKERDGLPKAQAVAAEIYKQTDIMDILFIPQIRNLLREQKVPPPPTKEEIAAQEAAAAAAKALEEKKERDAALLGKICEGVGQIIYPGDKRGANKISKDIGDALTLILVGDLSLKALTEKLKRTNGRCVVDNVLTGGNRVVLKYKFNKSLAMIDITWDDDGFEFTVTDIPQES